MSRPEIEEHQTPLANQEGAPQQQAAPPQREAQRRRGNRRDGLFQRNGGWWIDFADAEGKRYLTPDERDQLLNGVTVKAKDGRSWTAHQGPSPALRHYILAALQTGARRGELLNLRWADVDMRTRTVTFRQTKNGDSRTVPMTDTLRDALLALPRSLDAQAHVFAERDPQVLTRSFARLGGRLG